MASYSLPKLVILGLGAGALCLALALGSKARRISIATLSGLLLYVGLAMFAQDKYLAAVGNYNEYANGAMSVFIALCFYLYADVDKEKSLEILCLTCVAIALYAMYQAGTSAGLLIMTNGRAVSTIGCPVALGTILAIMLPISHARSAIYAIAILIGIVASGSRGALAAGLIGVVASRLRQ